MRAQSRHEWAVGGSPGPVRAAEGLILGFSEGGQPADESGQLPIAWALGTEDRARLHGQWHFATGS